MALKKFFVHLMEYKFECLSRYLNSCAIKKEEGKIKEILKIFYSHDVVIPFFDFNINTVCSLKCKKCDQGIPYLNNRCIYKYDELRAYLDDILEKVDYVHQISILGGEPFLNDDVDRIINYCASQKKIGSIIIVTNGTICPSKKILESLKNKKIIVGVSWYPLENDDMRKKLIKSLKLYDINYHVRRNEWLDFGDWKKAHNYSRKQLKSAFDSCFLKNCVQYNGGVLYRCAKQPLLIDQNIMRKSDVEAIDISNIKNKKEMKNALAVFYSVDFLKACDYCNKEENRNPIPMGEQL